MKWLLLILSLGLPGFMQAADFSLPVLMQSLAQVQRIEADFEEQKTLSILDTPLVFSGTLSYRAPDYIKKQTAEQELFILDGEWLTLETPQQGRQQFDLAGYRDLQPLTAALRGLLSGDLALLQRFYTLTLSGSMDAWQLQLVPRDPAAAALIEQITANGHRNRIERLLTVERNGDRSLMTISPH